MSRKWNVLYFITVSQDNPIKNFLDELEVREQVKVLRIFQYIQQYGLNSILPHTKKLAGFPLWEIRILGKDSIRILYLVPFANTVLLLHGFRKKTQKTPESELRIAMTRYAVWKKRSRSRIDK